MKKILTITLLSLFFLAQFGKVISFCYCSYRKLSCNPVQRIVIAKRILQAALSMKQIKIIHLPDFNLFTTMNSFIIVPLLIRLFILPQVEILVSIMPMSLYTMLICSLC
jgi:hypothetical protein